MAFENVYVPFTCKPFDMRFVAFICNESYQVLPVGELVTVIVLNCGNGRNALINLLAVLYPGYGTKFPIFAMTAELLSGELRSRLYAALWNGSRPNCANRCGETWFK